MFPNRHLIDTLHSLISLCMLSLNNDVILEIYLLCNPQSLKSIIITCRTLNNKSRCLYFRDRYAKKWLLELKRQYYHKPEFGLYTCLKLLRRRNFYSSDEDAYFGEMGYTDENIYYDAIPFFKSRVPDLVEHDRSVPQFFDCICLLHQSLEIGDPLLIETSLRINYRPDDLNVYNWICLGNMLSLIVSTSNIVVFNKITALSNFEALFSNRPDLSTELIKDSLLTSGFYYYSPSKFHRTDPAEMFITLLYYYLSHLFSEDSFLSVVDSSNNKLNIIRINFELLTRKIPILLESFRLAVSGGCRSLVVLTYQLLTDNLYGTNLLSLESHHLASFYNINPKEYSWLIEFTKQYKITLTDVPVNCMAFYNCNLINKYCNGFFQNFNRVSDNSANMEVTTLNRIIQNVSPSLTYQYLVNLLYNKIEFLNMIYNSLLAENIKLDNPSYLYWAIKTKLFNGLHSIAMQLKIIDLIITQINNEDLLSKYFWQMDVSGETLVDEIVRSCNHPIPILKLIFDRIPSSRRYNNFLTQLKSNQFTLIAFIVEYAHQHHQLDQIDFEILDNLTTDPLYQYRLNRLKDKVHQMLQ